VVVAWRNTSTERFLLLMSITMATVAVTRHDDDCGYMSSPNSLVIIHCLSAHGTRTVFGAAVAR
jgi:hypothetical protein